MRFFKGTAGYLYVNWRPPINNNVSNYVHETRHGKGKEKTGCHQVNVGFNPIQLEFPLYRILLLIKFGICISDPLEICTK